MGQYLATYPQTTYRFALYDNTRQLTRQQIQQETGCYALVNLWLFSMIDQPKYGVKYWDHQNGGVMLKGKWEYKKYDYPGICIDKDGTLTTGTMLDAKWDYASCVQANYIAGTRRTVSAYALNGLTYTGVNKHGDVVILVATKDTPMTGDEAMRRMLDAGCVDILRWDGSWSSQGYLGPGMDAQPSQQRKVRGYLLIYKRTSDNKKEQPMRKKVCLDPGHGPSCVNGSPDNTYKEHEFAWDMSQRITHELERCGVDVVCTRTKDTYPTLQTRCAVSNSANADLFVSLHSNASGSGWTYPHGFVIYTSMADDSAGRNIAAKAILARMREASVNVLGTGLQHNGAYTVLRYTNAPAMIIEYGFHTNRGDVAMLKDNSHRAKLAVATARGICDYLGVAYKEATVETPSVPEWARSAWEAAKTKGLLDGTRPAEAVTRQELAVILQRAGLI